MEKLLDAVAAVACLVSPEKVQAIASRIRRTETNKAAASLSGVVGTPAAAGVVERLIDAWRATSVSSEELSSMLLAASHVFSKAAAEQSTELVWTGPTTRFVSARKTEQALIQVINSAKGKLFITSYVAYNIASIAKALRGAAERGVEIKFLMELSTAHGGKVSVDPIGNLRKIVPNARFYFWKDKGAAFTNGSVHAKVAVADGSHCFITSANLTGYAMDQNMEAGVLISGAPLPEQLHRHLEALAITGVIVPVDE